MYMFDSFESNAIPKLSSTEKKKKSSKYIK